MKLAVGYIVFDGLETLEQSIRSIRETVDLVIVSYQTISWGGTQCSPNLLPTLNKLKNDKLIDHLIHFTKFIPSKLVSPNEVMQAKRFELNKRQDCLNFAISNKCTHYLSMDADEFYREHEFIKAKEIIENENLDATAVEYINYVSPTLHRGYARWKVPFIYRITINSRHHVMQTHFSGIDPTRGLVDDGYVKTKVLNRDDISMHHMEMVRNNLANKYYASSRFFPNRLDIPTLEEDINKARTTHKLSFSKSHLGDSSTPKEEVELIECENEFNISF